MSGGYGEETRLLAAMHRGYTWYRQGQRYAHTCPCERGRGGAVDHLGSCYLACDVQVCERVCCMNEGLYFGGGRERESEGVRVCVLSGVARAQGWGSTQVVF